MLLPGEAFPRYTAPRSEDVSKKRSKQRALAGVLGKDLTRRSRGRCELCEQRHEVRVFELAPFPEQPDPERALMACARCRGWLDAGTLDPVQAHFLGTAIWSQQDPVRLAAARLLLTERVDEAWVTEALEYADVNPKTGEFRHPPA